MCMPCLVLPCSALWCVVVYGRVGQCDSVVGGHRRSAPGQAGGWYKGHIDIGKAMMTD